MSIVDPTDDDAVNKVMSWTDKQGFGCDGVDIESPGLLYAFTYALHGLIWMVAYRSPIVQTHRELYTPVANVLTENPQAVLVHERTEKSEHMAWGEVNVRLWLIGEGTPENTP